MSTAAAPPLLTTKEQIAVKKQLAKLRRSKQPFTVKFIKKTTGVLRTMKCKPIGQGPGFTCLPRLPDQFGLMPICDSELDKRRSFYIDRVVCIEPAL